MTDPNEIIRALKLWFQPGDVFEVQVLVGITDEVKSMAKTLTLWFFAQAEKVLSGIMDCDLRSRDVEKKLIRGFEIIRDQDRGNGVITSTISRYSTGTGTTSSDRSKLLGELMERGWISLENSRYKVSNPPPGMAKAKVRKVKMAS